MIYIYIYIYIHTHTHTHTHTHIIHSVVVGKLNYFPVLALPQPSKSWDYRHVVPCLIARIFFKTIDALSKS
jgi:hypothetical protein